MTLHRIKGLILNLILSGALPLSACTSISFFPQLSAQRAADKVIEDIWPVPTGGAVSGKEKTEKAEKAEKAFQQETHP